MAICVFCGDEVRKSVRTREHVLPMWLLKATGDPNRKIRIEFDPDTGADVIRPASTFHFPACGDCNEFYGRTLEAQAKAAFETLSGTGSLRVSQCYHLLDWLDKVRIGLWLGFHALHKEVFVPKFRIDSRLGKKDRVAVVSVDPEDRFKGLHFGGCDNNVFRTSQAGLYVRINNVRILTFSFDCLISKFAGAPFCKQMLQVEHTEQHAGIISPGSGIVSQDWKEFGSLGATVIAQPVFWPGGVDIENVADMFFNAHMAGNLRKKPKITRLEHLQRFFQMQLISNSGGTFRFHRSGNERVRFVKAPRNDDGSFMLSLCRMLLQHVLPLSPLGVVDRQGRKHGNILLTLLTTEKLLQIVLRLEGLGASDPKLKDELIDEVHKLTRLREESQSHIHGTCLPDSGVLFRS
jgi:hypothetical protein